MPTLKDLNLRPDSINFSNEEMGQAIANHCNSSSFRQFPDIAKSAIEGTHCTVQTHIYRMAIALIRQIAEIGYTDPRNEVAVQRAKAIVNFLKEQGMDNEPPYV